MSRLNEPNNAGLNKVNTYSVDGLLTKISVSSQVDIWKKIDAIIRVKGKVVSNKVYGKYSYISLKGVDSSITVKCPANLSPNVNENIVFEGMPVLKPSKFNSGLDLLLEGTPVAQLAPDVAKAPSWIDVYEDYLKCTEDKIILAYNAKFDKRMIQQSCKAHGLVNRRRQWDCVMFAYSEFMGNTKNGVYRWHKLVDAAFNCGVQINNAESGPHRALYDAGLTLGVHKFMQLEVDKFLNKN